MWLVFLMDSSLSRMVAKAAILVLNHVRLHDACGHGDLAFNEVLLGLSAAFIKKLLLRRQIITVHPLTSSPSLAESCLSPQTQCWPMALAMNLMT